MEAKTKFIPTNIVTWTAKDISEHLFDHFCNVDRNEYHVMLYNLLPVEILSVITYDECQQFVNAHNADNAESVSNKVRDEILLAHGWILRN